MFNSLKKKKLNRSLKKYKIVREKRIMSLDKTRSIAMMCQITDEESYKEIHDLLSKLHSPRRNVWLLGYINKKEVPYYCLPQLSADYFSNKELNWYGKPNFSQLKDFISKDFDVLIDFSRQDLSPLRYVLSICNAKLIIGANEYAEELYDVYIQDENNMDNLSLLKTIHNYLHKLTGG